MSTVYREDDERTDHDLCPRCGIRYMPAGYPGALSRVDNEHEICSPCGTIEALSGFYTGHLVPVDEWPTLDLDIAEEATS